MTNKELKRWYLSINRKFFHGMLDKDAVVEFADITGCVACARYITGKTRKPTPAEKRERPNCVAVIPRVPWIRVSKKIKFSRSLTIPSLVHEMVHIENYSWNGHGWRFNRRMLQLAKAGAFNGWW